MPTLKAKISKGKPTCPKCGYTYKTGEMNDCGIDGDRGFWFTFLCPICSSVPKIGKRGKKLKSESPKVFVKYFSDKDFNLVQRRG